MFNYKTLPDTVTIDGVEYKKVYNAPKTAFNYEGKNGEKKMAVEVQNHLNSLPQSAQNAPDSTTTADTLNAPVTPQVPPTEAPVEPQASGDNSLPTGVSSTATANGNVNPSAPGIAYPEAASEANLGQAAQNATEPSDAQ